MAFENIIPQSKSPIDAFSEGIASSQNMINSLTENKLKAAQAAREQKMADLPFGGMNVPGPAGQVVALEMVRKLYGDESPQYQQAKRSFDLSQASDASRMNYQNALTGSIPLRYTSPEGRSFIEQSNVGQGYSPAGTPAGQPVSPGQPGYQSPYATSQEAADQYGLTRLHKNIPASTLNSSLKGSNAEQTLGNINVDDLTHYSGLKGAGQLAADKGKSMFGITTPEFKKFNDAITQAQLLAKQYRQMMADSITPSNQEALNYLTNPTSWILNPEVATSKFNQFAKTLKQENATFKNATKSIAPYSDENYKAPMDASKLGRKDVVSIANKDQAAADQKNNSATIHMISPDGKSYDVPASKAQKFIDNGYKRGS